ncbi:ATPase, T2SS/T4P/T4SS family [Streptomyces sp. NBC_01386]|uniref:CpaF family protein n=1 Tax=Streptomyces sp. NBC_01386 TaxID=2903848 RepID=UPI00324D7DB9
MTNTPTGPDKDAARTQLGRLLSQRSTHLPEHVAPATPDPRTAQAHPAPTARPVAPAPAPVVPVAPVTTSSSAGAGAMGVSDFAGTASLPGTLPVSPEEIQKLRVRVAEDLRAVRERQQAQTLEAEEERELAELFARRQIAAWHAEFTQKNPPLSKEQRSILHEEVLNLTFRAGALQRLLDQPGVQNIDIDGDVMYVDVAGQQRQKMASPFAGREQTIAWINTMAAQSGHGERQLSYASPYVEFRLPDDSRVAANVLTRNVSVSIRKHGGRAWTLGNLLQEGTVDQLLASFLSAAVRAHMNIVICGGMAAGKTTLMRAMGREIPASERLITLESSLELFLDDAETPCHTLAFETRQSNGEDGAGAITLSDLIEIALRYNADRIMVGEVRGRESMAMLEAMSASQPGSMCTLHADYPKDVITRLVLRLSMADLSAETSYRLIEGAVHLMVFVKKGAKPGEKIVSHVWEVDGLNEDGTPSMTQLFAPRPGDGRAVPTAFQMSPERAEQIAEAGFNPLLLAQYPHGTWESDQSGERRAS